MKLANVDKITPKIKFPNRDTILSAQQSCLYLCPYMGGTYAYRVDNACEGGPAGRGTKPRQRKNAPQGGYRRRHARGHASKTPAVTVSRTCLVLRRRKNAVGTTAPRATSERSYSAIIRKMVVELSGSSTSQTPFSTENCSPLIIFFSVPVAKGKFSLREPPLRTWMVRAL